MNGIFSLTPELRAEFFAACTQEPVYGAKIATALEVCGQNPPPGFYLAQQGADRAALFLSCGSLLLASGESFFSDALPAWIATQPATEISCRLPLCEKLQARLGGSIESSYFMEYRSAAAPAAESPRVTATRDLRAVFSVLQQSHDYYRSHLHWERWADELTKKLDLGLAELVLATEDGKPVGTGSIGAQTEEAAVVAGVAVVPKARHNGLGKEISAELTRRILQKNKTPMLLSGYDAVAALYRQIGYTQCGRWGELHL